MLQLGSLDGVKCPVCGCDSRMEVDCVDGMWSDDGKTAKAIYSATCQECNSLFEIIEHYKIEFQDIEMNLSYEQHESNFGEGSFA